MARGGRRRGAGIHADVRVYLCSGQQRQSGHAARQRGRAAHHAHECARRPGPKVQVRAQLAMGTGARAYQHCAPDSRGFAGPRRTDKTIAASAVSSGSCGHRLQPGSTLVAQSAPHPRTCVLAARADSAAAVQRHLRVCSNDFRLVVPPQPAALRHADRHKRLRGCARPARPSRTAGTIMERTRRFHAIILGAFRRSQCALSALGVHGAKYHLRAGHRRTGDIHYTEMVGRPLDSPPLAAAGGGGRFQLRGDFLTAALGHRNLVIAGSPGVHCHTKSGGALHNWTQQPAAAPLAAPASAADNACGTLSFCAVSRRAPLGDCARLRSTATGRP